jgi:hypothetical protein
MPPFMVEVVFTVPKPAFVDSLFAAPPARHLLASQDSMRAFGAR